MLTIFNKQKVLKSKTVNSLEKLAMKSVTHYNHDTYINTDVSNEKETMTINDKYKNSMKKKNIS